MTWQLVDTAEVAARTGMSPEWVRDHAAELGAVRMGDSPRGPLRFDLDRVRAAIDRRRLVKDDEARGRRRPGPRRDVSNGVELIPLPKG